MADTPPSAYTTLGSRRGHQPHPISILPSRNPQTTAYSPAPPEANNNNRDTGCVGPNGEPRATGERRLSSTVRCMTSPDLSPLQSPTAPLSPWLSQSSSPRPVSREEPEQGNGAARLHRPSHSDLAKQALEAYRSEPAARPPTGDTVARVDPLNYSRERRNDLLSPRVPAHSTQPYSVQAIREQYKAVPGSLLLSRQVTIQDRPIQERPIQSPNTLDTTYKLLRTPPSRTQNFPSTPDDYGRSPPSTPHSPHSGFSPLPKRKLPLRSIQTHNSPRPRRTSLVDIVEESPIYDKPPVASPQLDARSPSLPANPPPTPIKPSTRMRAVSATVPSEVMKERIREQTRKDHITHGTWQQGRFRPPWDELTVVGSGTGSVVEASGRRASFDASRLSSSPSLQYRGLVSPQLPGRGSSETFRRISLDSTRTTAPTPEQYHTGIEPDSADPPTITDLLALLPPGPPTTLKAYYLLQVLAEHYFDTLQPALAIHIYTRYLAPPPPPQRQTGHPSASAIVIPPKAATYFTLGQLYLSTHAFLSALAAFQRAAELDPFDVASQVQVGYISFLLGEYAGAAAAYRRALAGFRETAGVNYRVLGLDVAVRRGDVLRSAEFCEFELGLEMGREDGGAGAGGVWGIGSGKIYRLPEEKKRNLGRRRYFEQGRVVGRAVEVGRVGWEGARKVENVEWEGVKLGRIRTGGGGSSVWSWTSPGPVRERLAGWMGAGAGESLRLEGVGVGVGIGGEERREGAGAGGRRLSFDSVWEGLRRYSLG